MTLTQLFAATKEETAHKPFLIGVKSSCKNFERSKQELLGSKRFVQSSIQNKD